MKQVEFARVIGELVGRGQPFAVATVTKTEGASIGKPGFKVVMSEAGEPLYGTLGGGCPESVIVPAARKTMKTGVPKTVRIFLESTENAVEAVVKSSDEDEIHVETNCGGMLEVYIEPYLPTERLIIVGQGGKDDVEDALVKYGKLLDFEVVVIDHSPMLTEQPDKLMADATFDVSGYEFSATDSVVVLTTGERDVSILKALSRHDVRYLGMLASSRRSKDDMDKLRKDGISEEYIDSIRAPIGADIGALTPAEIALSVMAEVVAVKHGKTIPRKGARSDAEAQKKP